MSVTIRYTLEGYDKIKDAQDKGLLIGSAKCEGCKYNNTFSSECDHCIRHHESDDYYINVEVSEKDENSDG